MITHGPPQREMKLRNGIKDRQRDGWVDLLLGGPISSRLGMRSRCGRPVGRSVGRFFEHIPAESGPGRAGAKAAMTPYFTYFSVIGVNNEERDRDN